MTTFLGGANRSRDETDEDTGRDGAGSNIDPPLIGNTATSRARRSRVSLAIGRIASLDLNFDSGRLFPICWSSPSLLGAGPGAVDDTDAVSMARALVARRTLRIKTARSLGHGGYGSKPWIRCCSRTKATMASTSAGVRPSMGGIAPKDQ
jgi:hypothetical protein